MLVAAVDALDLLVVRCHPLHDHTRVLEPTRPPSGTELVLNHRLTVESSDGPTPFRYRYTLHPRADGASSVRLDGRISGVGLPGPLGRVDPLATRVFRHGMRRNLAELKRVVESTASHRQRVQR